MPVIEEGPKSSMDSSAHYSSPRSGGRLENRSPASVRPDGSSKGVPKLGSSFAVHQDAVCDLQLLTYPQTMLVSGGRDGVVKVWK